MTQTHEPMVYIIVDGEYVFNAPWRIARRAPTKSERADYSQLILWAEQEYGTEQVQAFYIYRVDERAGPFLDALERLGYEISEVDPDQQYETLREALIWTVSQAKRGDCVVYVGGADGKFENDQGRVPHALQRVKESDAALNVLAFSGWYEFDKNEFPFIDLADEVRMMPPSLFSRAQREQSSDSGRPSFVTGRRERRSRQ